MTFEIYYTEELKKLSDAYTEEIFYSSGWFLSCKYLEKNLCICLGKEFDSSFLKQKLDEITRIISQ